jgi:hypothetical protein
MILLDRMALIVRPKRRFVDWVNGLGTATPKLTIEEARTNPTVYLVTGVGDQDGRAPLSDIVDAYADEIFESELEGWSSDESAWPQNRSPHTFRQFFDAEMAEIVEDADEDEPLVADLDPDADDLDPDSGELDPDADELDYEDDELDADAGTGPPEADFTAIAQMMQRCAWCGREIAEDEQALPVGFARLLPAADGERGPATRFPLPRAGRILMGVRPPFEPEGAPDTKVILTVCSEACRAGLVVAVEDEKKG